MRIRRVTGAFRVALLAAGLVVLAASGCGSIGVVHDAGAAGGRAGGDDGGDAAGAGGAAGHGDGSTAGMGGSGTGGRGTGGRGAANDASVDLPGVVDVRVDTGPVTCTRVQGCCASDADCAATEECAGTTCGPDRRASGVCKPRLPRGGLQCWRDADCIGQPGICVGAIVCPCGSACLRPDAMGACGA